MEPRKHLLLAPHVLSRPTAILIAAAFFFLPCAARTSAQSAKNFRWLGSSADAATWAKIQDAFRNELQRDAPRTDGGTMFAYKFIERVGVVDQSALVIVGHKTSKAPKKEEADERFASLFNFDLKTGAITRIDREDGLWHWDYQRLVQFEAHGAPDVAFTYLSCWECEPAEMFSTLHYDAARKQWALREWQPDKMIWWTGQDGLVVNADLLEGTDDTLSFACLYGALPLPRAHAESFASRCHEVTETSNGRKIGTDVTVIYSLDGERLKLEPVTRLPEVQATTTKLCARQSSNPVCKLPALSTYSSQERTMLGMFPTARNNRRDPECFRALHGNFSVYSVVDRCGRPDAGGGTAIGFFEYGLDDGSTVIVHWTDMQHVLDIVQSDKSGKTKTLLASK